MVCDTDMNHKKLSTLTSIKGKKTMGSKNNQYRERAARFDKAPAYAGRVREGGPTIKYQLDIDVMSRFNIKHKTQQPEMKKS